MPATASASYNKLRDGSWGIKVQGSAKPGDRITVTKRDGSSKVETVDKVVWSGNGVAICSVIETRGASSSSSGGRRNAHGNTSRAPAGTYECEECGEYVRKGTRCWETGHTH